MSYSATGTDAFAFSSMLYLAGFIVSHNRTDFWILVFTAVAFFIARAFGVMSRHVVALRCFVKLKSMFVLISNRW